MASDHILALDRKQADPETRIVCPKDPEHGTMGVHASGAYLVCTFRIEPRKVCGVQVPVAVE